MSEYHDYDYVYKIIIIGDSCVGKSSMLKRFTNDTYDETFISTIGVDFMIKTIEKNGKLIKLQIWDTAGQERFRTISSTYYRGANGIILVYDVTNAKSFENITIWINEIFKYIPLDSANVMIVGNKCDLIDHKIIDDSIAKEFCVKNNFPFIETSAKNSKNINEAFDIMVNEIIKKPTLLNKKNKESELLIAKRKSGSSCCG